MTSRERVLNAVNFRRPGRIPVDLGAIRASGVSAVVYDRLKKRMRDRNLLSHTLECTRVRATLGEANRRCHVPAAR